MTRRGGLITRVALRNYKSIAGCDVSPARLCFLVGRNGSGKSNFVDALRFVSDSLSSSMDQALLGRGGINEVRRRSGGHPTHFTIRIEFELPTSRGHYAFTVGSKPKGRYEVQHEECLVIPGQGKGSHFYKVETGQVTKATMSPAPAALSDRLYLVNVSGIGAFRPVYDALSGTGFYNLNPEAIRDLQLPDPGDLLKRDGSNIASVLANLASASPTLKRQIEEYLGAVVPGITGVDRHRLGPRETLEFRQAVRGAEHPWRFFANSMSDGTLRSLGVLVALFQSAGNGRAGPGLVGIEEPELALHPAAAEVLIDALQDATAHAQILVTSHSPDLLDNDQIQPESILAVAAAHGETRIGPLDAVGEAALKDHLFTAGELLRMDQLDPDPDLSTPGQVRLFGPEG